MSNAPCRRTLFVVSATAFLAHQLAQRGWGWSLPWADRYLDDLLCLPVVLGLATWAMRVVLQRPAYRLSAGQITFAWLSVTGVFELWLPRVRPDYTADVWDVPVYAAGGVLFWLAENWRKGRGIGQ